MKLVSYMLVVLVIFQGQVAWATCQENPKLCEEYAISLSIKNQVLQGHLDHVTKQRDEAKKELQEDQDRMSGFFWMVLGGVLGAAGTYYFTSGRH